MDLRELELFGTLMRVGTTTETARLLGISQPGVSGQLKRLESRLGVSLFHRTGNRLEPTHEANELFALAVPIFMMLEMDQPYGGLVKIPSTSLRVALDQLGGE